MESKYATIAKRYTIDTKQYKAARYIVRQNRKITTEERRALCDEIQLKDSTLRGVFVELKKMGLYPPAKRQTVPELVLTPASITSDTKVTVPQHQPSLQPEFASIHDLNALRKDIQYLAAVINGDNIPNAGAVQTVIVEEPEYEEPEEIEYEVPKELELHQTEELYIKDPSLTRHSIWLKPKTQMYFDMARQGIFANYVDSRDLGPFTQFKGNLSDFFNVIVDDYFLRNYNADIGLLMRRYA